MGIDKLIALGAVLAILAVATSRLPHAILAVQLAHFQLIQATLASKWPKAALLPANQ